MWKEVHLSEDYSVVIDFFPSGLAKILLGVPMDPILNFLERADKELSENVYFCPPPPPPRCTVIELSYDMSPHLKSPVPPKNSCSNPLVNRFCRNLAKNDPIDKN